MGGQGISKVEVDRFNEEGFLVLNSVFDVESVERARSRFEPVFAGEYETGVQPDKVKWIKGRDPEGIPRQVCNAWKSDTTLAGISLAEGIGRIASRLMGWPGARVNQDNIIWVPPGAGTIGFHQDDSYQDWHEPDGIITCWIALNETVSNGGTLEYARGSHKWRLGPRVEQFMKPNHYQEDLLIAADTAHKEIDIVPVIIPMGSVSFHHGKLWHGSNYNYANESRYTISIHYMSSVSQFHPETPSPVFDHYKHFGESKMAESFFPIVWSEEGHRSQFIDNYIA